MSGIGAAICGDLFAAARPIVGLCASGILIRAVAPLLADKTRRAAGRRAWPRTAPSAVPLLGGHHGANALARARCRGARRDRGGHHRGRSAARLRARRTAAGLAHRQPGAMQAGRGGAAGRRAGRACRRGRLRRLAARRELSPGREGSPARSSSATDRAQRPGDRRGSSSIRPSWRSASAASAASPAEELPRWRDDTLAEAGLAAGAVACVVSIDLKADEPAVHALARRARRSGAVLPGGASARAKRERLTIRSEAVFRATGCWGVAEGAALAAAGAGRRAGRAAAASRAAPPAPSPRAAALLDAARSAGRAAGWRSSASARAARPGAPRGERAACGEPTRLVGYGLYLDLLGRAIAGKRAARSRRSARRRSGPARARSRRRGPVGGAGLLGRPRHLRSGRARLRAARARAAAATGRAVEIASRPGCRRMQAAAARAGAPLGHDFCAISLSDLLTPVAGDRARGCEAAAAADFVVALYNPRLGAAAPASSPAAADILLRAPPARRRRCVLARNLGRAGESCADRCRLTSWPRTSRHADARAGRQQPHAPAPRGADAAGSTRRAVISTSRDRVTVHFIGAGPGAPDLITVRGLRLIERCPVCLYAGSLVPPASWPTRAGGRAGRRHRAADPGRDHRRDRRRRTAAGSTSRGSIPATRRSMARSPSRCAGSMRSASRSTSRRACRPSPPPPPRWAAS